MSDLEVIIGDWWDINEGSEFRNALLKGYISCLVDMHKIHRNKAAEIFKYYTGLRMWDI